MKSTYLLIVSLYALGPICADCYVCEEVSKITYAGPVIDDNCAAKAELLEGNVATKCIKIKAEVSAKGVVVGGALDAESVMKVGMYDVKGITIDPTVALLVHDNPKIILSRSTIVYYSRD